jgi:hypothetical protein
MIGNTALSSLPKLRDYTSHRVSSYDRGGGNLDFWGIDPNTTRVFAEIEGPACIKHIWMTMGVPNDDYCRRVLIRMYWDDCAEPSVECPIGDFFGIGHGIRKNFVSAPLQMSPENGQGFNCWFPMPFRKNARIEVENQGPEPYWHWFYIDYEKYPSVASLEDQCYFHAQWRREDDTNGWADGLPKDYNAGADPRFFNTTGEGNYVVLEATGNGVFCGAHLDIDCFRRNRNDWFGEGDDMIFIDGEPFPPSIHGTGTEDWYNCAMCPTQEYNSPYIGITKYSGNENWRWKGKNSVYRYHIEDPIRFRKSILFSIEHGSGNKLSNDYSSTAYYYLDKPQKGGPDMLPVEKRLPRHEEEPVCE